MRRFPVAPVLAGLALLAAGGVARAQEGARPSGTLRHDFAAASAGTVTLRPDGVVEMHARNARLVPYVRFDGMAHLPRLATITTDVRVASDAEGPEPGAARVEVTVDDLSASPPRRLATFADPGVEARILAARYVVTTLPGCCAAPNQHVVRNAETGALLFRATGATLPGGVAWAEAPNSRPHLVRWAAWDGTLTEADPRDLLGVLAYGDETGPLSRLALRMRRAEAREELALALGQEARLVWVDEAAARRRRTTRNGAGRPDDARPPQGGTADSPAPIWSLEGRTAPGEIGGFSLRLLDPRGRAVATIPVAADRLDAARATLAPGLAIEPRPAR